MTHLLQITGKIHQEKSNKDLGSTKDMDARGALLRDNGCTVTNIGIQSRSDKLCLEYLKSRNLKNLTHILFEHNRYPKSQIWIKQNHPQIKIIVRAHNAEFLHSVDKSLAIFNQPFHSGLKRKIKALIKNNLRTIKTLYLDVRTANNCDVLISCSAYETENYWKKIVYTDCCRTVGTFSVIDELEKTSEPAGKKNKLRVCMVGGSSPSDFNDLSLSNFFCHLMKMSNETKENFDFSFSGKYNTNPLISVPNCAHLKDGTSFKRLMKSFDVLVICTHLGRGIKTKILDAMACGKYVIIPSKVMHRLDPLLQKNCISYDGSHQGFERQLLNLKVNPPFSKISIKEAHSFYRAKYQTELLNIILCENN